MASFDWDEGNIQHATRHGVTTVEIEEVIQNNPIDLTYGLRSGEERTEQIGETFAGRIVRVISTLRNEKVRPIAAIPLRTKWHARYFALKENSNAGKENDS
jgi:uncharacterized DUF497 family protein